MNFIVAIAHETLERKKSATMLAHYVVNLYKNGATRKREKDLVEKKYGSYKTMINEIYYMGERK